MPAATPAFEGFRRHAPHRRPFLLTRAGYAGIQRYAAAWTGDNSSHWEHLELSMPMLMGLGLSGVAFTGVDIPGFIGRPSAELFARWTQLGTFYPLMRNHAAKPMPFQAHRRHQYWTVDVRYIDVHQLGGGNIYSITILDNYSRFIVGSAISRTQDQPAFLRVLLSAVTEYGAPEAIVSDGGSIFKAKRALAIYVALGIIAWFLSPPST